MGIQEEDTVREGVTTAAPPDEAPAPPDHDASPRGRRRLPRLRAAAARVPRPLAALLGAVAIFGIAWALIVPPWQKVDEITHFAYVQSLAERGELPGNGPNTYSSAQYWSQFALNHETVRVNPEAKPEWSRATYELWKARAPLNSPSDGGGPSPASGYPPAYYLIEAAAYHLGDGGDVTSHLYADRLVSAIWLLITTIGTWLLAGELLGRRRVLQLVAAAAVGLWPMIDEISSDVDPDAMLYAEWTFTLWLGVKIIRHGLTVGRALALGACVGLAMVTKATSLGLLPAAGFALLYGLWRLRPRGLRRMATALVVALAVFAAPVGAWALVTRAQSRPAYAQAGGITTSQGTNWKEFLSYVWQFYLPRLPFQHPVHFDNRVLSDYPAYNVWVATSWAAFGWIDAYLPRWMYPIFLAITVLVIVLAITKVALVVRRLRGPPRLLRRLPRGAVPVFVFLALALVVLLAGLHWTEYRNRYPTNHGQYLFPLASYAGVALALAVSLAPRRWRPTVAGGVIGSLVAYELLCLGFIATRFYGLVS